MTLAVVKVLELLDRGTEPPIKDSFACLDSSLSLCLLETNPPFPVSPLPPQGSSIIILAEFKNVSYF